MKDRYSRFMKSFILAALPIYAVLSLSSMAGMNIGFLILFLGLIAGFFHARGAGVALAAPSASLNQALREYRLWGWVLFGACVFSLLCAQLFPYSYAGHAPEVTWHGYQKIWYLICPFIILMQFRYSMPTEAQFEKTLRVWWAALFLFAAMAVVQFFTGWPLRQPIPTNPGYYHAILLLGHHLSVSSVMIFPTFTALAIAFGSYARHRRFDKFEAFAGMAGILILFLTYARTSWLAIPIGIVLLFARNLKPKPFLAAVGVLVVLLGGLSQTPMIKERIDNSMGIRDRVRLWEANVDYFKHRPITGIGWLKTAEMSEFYFKQKDPAHYHDYFWGHAHSNFFEMLGGTGLIGLLAFLAWSWFTLKLAYRTSLRALKAGQERWSDFAWGILVALLLLHFNGLTNVTFWEGKVMHQQMLAVGMLLILQLWV